MTLEIERRMGGLVRRFRRDNHMKREQLAAQLGISREELRSYEEGTASMPLFLLSRMSKIFNVHPYSFFDPEPLFPKIFDQCALEMSRIYRELEPEKKKQLLARAREMIAE